jgi:MFS family permease
VYFKDALLPAQFAGAYFAATFLLFGGMLVLSRLKFATPASIAKDIDTTNARPLAEIMLQPRFITALICAIGSYALMSFVMTAAPLAMVGCGISHTDAILGIQWHVMAMFVPSFFTGHLIARFGKEPVIATGFIILIACAIVALQGQLLWQFWVSLILLGLGWNLGFIGATAMLTETYTEAERSKTQGINDFLLFGSVAFASLMSGQTLNAFGWYMLNWIVFPVVMICLISLVWLRLKSKETA